MVQGMRSPDADLPRAKLLIIVCLEISPSKQTFHTQQKNSLPIAQMRLEHADVRNGNSQVRRN